MSIYDFIDDARLEAHRKHGSNSLESLPGDDPKWLPVLVEEVGEVARALTYDGNKEELRKELIQVAAVASAWADKL